MGARFFAPTAVGTREQLAREGVVFIDRLLGPADVAQASAALRRYERDVLPNVTPIDNERYADGTLRCIHDLHRYDPWFLEFATRPRVMDVIRAAVPWEPVLYYTETFPKPDGAGALPPHQELYTVPVDPPDFVHLWIALEDVSAVNGGLAFYRRTHRFGLAPHAPQSGSYGVDPVVLDRIAHLRVEPDYPAGAAAVFDCRTVHVSGANHSGKPRPVLVLAYRGAHTAVPSEVDVCASILARYMREETSMADCAPDTPLEPAPDPAAAERVCARIRAAYGVRVGSGELTAGTPYTLAEHVTSLVRERATALSGGSRPTTVPAAAGGMGSPVARTDRGW